QLRIEAVKRCSCFPQRIRFSRTDRLFGCRLRSVGFHRFLAPARFSEFVAATVYRNPGQPPRRGLIRPHFVNSRKCFQANILRNVLDTLTRSEETTDEPKHHRRKLIHDGFVSRSVTRLSTNDQLSVKFHNRLRRVDRWGYSFFQAGLQKSYRENSLPAW